MTTFWLLAPIMVIAALGLIFAKKAVHAALALAVVMISLAILYAAQGAPFLFAVQIIVYTGAIMMLFLFVLMLVGVDSSEAVKETIAGQWFFAAVIGLVFGVTAVIAIGQTVSGAVVGLRVANGNGNPYGLAELLFGKYVLAFEFTSALLITAALGAMVLAHKERLTPRQSQASIAARRMREYAESGRHLGPQPTPGVFARHNAVDTPALLPDGTPLETSVSQSIIDRGQVRDGFDDDVETVTRQLEPEEGEEK